MPSADEILATFPEFAPPPAAQAMYLSLADKRTADRLTWNDDEDLRNLAVALRAAGMMADLGIVGSAPASASGPVTAERIGSLSVSYSAPAAGENPLTNAYWRQLAQLEAENIFPAITSYTP